MDLNSKLCDTDETKEAVEALFEADRRDRERFKEADERVKMSEVWQRGYNAMCLWMQQ